MTTRPGSSRVKTGVRNLDELLVRRSARGRGDGHRRSARRGEDDARAGNFAFNTLTAARPALYFGTLSEPAAKTLEHLSRFSFFEADKLNLSVEFVDPGAFFWGSRTAEAVELVMTHVKQKKPGVIVIDSFKVFDGHRGLETGAPAVRVRARRCSSWPGKSRYFSSASTAPTTIATNPLFSIVDGLVPRLARREQSGRAAAFHADREDCAAPTQPRRTSVRHQLERHRGVRSPGHDKARGPRVARHSLQDRYLQARTTCSATGSRAARACSWPESPGRARPCCSSSSSTGERSRVRKGSSSRSRRPKERLCAAAEGLGWDFEAQIERGMIEIIFIPQPDIPDREAPLMMRDRIEGSGVQRVAVDSVSVFLHKVKDPQTSREKDVPAREHHPDAQASACSRPTSLTARRRSAASAWKRRS